MKEFLDSDRVNFLIWRHLIEGNYRETAAKFQKEWHIQEPHRHFDWAQHVKNHALVSVLNKGLLYHSLERDYYQQQSLPHSALAPAGVFGPLITQPPVPHSSSILEKREDQVGEIPLQQQPQPQSAAGESAVGAEPADETENSRKRQAVERPHNAMLNGSPAKKPRLSNGYDNGSDTATVPMEIDHPAAENNHAYPSPLEGESAQTPIPRTDGPEQGTQVEKVQELAADTIFLRLMPDDSPAPSADSTSPSQPTSATRNDHPIVLHCEWNPRDPSILAAAGTDALARVWTVSRATAPEPSALDHVNGVNRPYEDLIEDDIPRTSTVTAMAWNWDGSAIAVATESGNRARISIWAPDGTAMHRFHVSEPPVIKLRWNPSNASILGIAPDNGGTLVTVFSALTSNTMSYFFQHHDLVSDPLDAAWISETEFLLCGGDLLMSLRCTEDSIVPNRKFETRPEDNFGQVQFDWRSSLVATATDKGVIDLWDESGQRRSIAAHIRLITSLTWQPLQATPPEDERLLASGGDDGAISIWNARLPESKAKCTMTMGSPVVAVAFTPDGAFIAGATTDQILIWKVGDHAIPRASWSRKPHPDWLSPKMNGTGDSDEEDTHCLCWDSEGQKLAFGANSRLAVINFR